MTTEDNRAPGKPPVVPDQKTLALINTYIASTTNQAAAACERTMHTIDRRWEACTCFRQIRLVLTTLDLVMNGGSRLSNGSGLVCTAQYLKRPDSLRCVTVLCLSSAAFPCRLERVSINMSLLEEKVDSAVASHEAAEVAKRTVKPAPASQAEPCAEEPLSTAASASDGMEEIDTGPAVPGPSPTREGAQRCSCTALYQALQCMKACQWSLHSIEPIHALHYRRAAGLYANSQTRCMRTHLWRQRSGHNLRWPSCLRIVADPVDDSRMKPVVGPGAVPGQQSSQLGGSRPR